MTIDWSQHLATAGLNKDAIKANLPLQYVVLKAGVVLEQTPDGRLAAQCPFHADERPSFDIYRKEGENFDRCGCWACRTPWHADVLDFIQTWKGCGFKDALQLANELYREFSDDDWKPVLVDQQSKPRMDPEVLTDVVRDAQARISTNKNAVHEFLHQKAENDVGFQGMDPDWLISEFRLGTLDDVTIIIPHYNAGGFLQGYKHRTAYRPPFSGPGVSLSELYGIWRIKGHNRIIICEGESDTWATAWAFRDESVDVVGLPSGASANVKEEWKEHFAEKQVIIMFDGDRAGRSAAEKWHEGLRYGKSLIWIAAVDEDGDASSTANLKQVVENALDVPDLPSGFMADGMQYVRPTKEDSISLSNFVFLPERFLESQSKDGIAYEGYIMPRKRWVTIRTSDFENKRAMIRWSGKHGYQWTGSDTDAQKFGMLLRAQAPFLPRATMTDVAGWHEETGSFVLPRPGSAHETMVIPSRPHWSYIPGTNNTNLHERILIEPGGLSVAGFQAMMGLHTPEVIHPLVAWLAATPFRSRVKQFPILMVSGGAGFGKTTIVEEVLRVFGWRGGTTVTGTTRFSIESFVQASNAAPVWVDEYRLGAREDTKLAFDQILRDAWDGKSTFRGGMNQGNLMQLTERKALAPILVSGEEAFQETSHLERSAVIKMPKEGRNSKALDVLRRSDMSGFGFTYLAWLAQTHRQRPDDLPLPKQPAEADRPAWVRAVLMWGWDLLSMFADEVMHIEIGDLNLDRIERAIDEARDSNPILDSLAWAIGKPDPRDRLDVVWFDGDDLMVRITEFTSMVKRDGSFTLPGGRKAVADWLRAYFDLPENYETEKYRFDALGVTRTALRIPRARATVEERLKH
jgi:hypothetical protein